ncbi:hypothetical protein AAG570_005893 [Ranatra chinensis]|uniref:PDZ domain-containing protein n=1 Tax=Ranatra chinensis TaxID=642074 RepID=A0ABD0YBI5_9HEMI
MMGGSNTSTNPSLDNPPSPLFFPIPLGSFLESVLTAHLWRATVNVELNRGWNSRLGFSLQAGGPTGDDTVISAIYPDSVASRCGKLRVGDVLVNVNDESVEDMKTADVIDLLRKIRGIICLTLLRKLD